VGREGPAAKTSENPRAPRTPHRRRAHRKEGRERRRRRKERGGALRTKKTRRYRLTEPNVEYLGMGWNLGSARKWSLDTYASFQ